MQAWQVPGAPVQGYVWEAGQPRGAVLLTHGFGEYASRYVTGYSGLIPALTEAGFTVYAYDQRGHGESAGRRAVVDVEHGGPGNLGARRTDRGVAAANDWVALARDLGHDPVHLAIAFVRARPFPAIPIIGATHLDQLDHLIAGLDLRLDAEADKAIDAFHRAHPLPY